MIDLAKLKKSEYFDTLAIYECDIKEPRPILCNHKAIYEGACGNDLYNWEVRFEDEDGILNIPDQQRYYSTDWLDDAYELDDDLDLDYFRENPDQYSDREGDVDGDVIYKYSDYEGGVVPVRKLNEYDSDIRRTLITIYHGINNDTFDLTDDDIIHGKVYEAPLCIHQDYPDQEYEDAFAFVPDDGEVRYIKRTLPFNEDRDCPYYEFIDEEEFATFCE